MLSYSEVILLRDKLAKGEISLASAQEAYWKDFKEGQRSWETKDWKERRAAIIKDKCQICSSSETLTLQHGSHPQKHSEYLREVTRRYTENYISTGPTIDKDEFSYYVSSKYEYVAVSFCPYCKWSNPSRRVKKLPVYRCAGCKHEFDDPVYKSFDELISIFFENEDAIEVRDKCFVSKDQYRNKQSLSNIRYWFQREQAKNMDAETIGKEAFLLYLNASIHYLSFEDTITACKKCAFNLDIKKMELCPYCKEYYKGIQYPTCIQCLPEDRRKAALESIQFGKQMHEIHKNLGID
jgi:ribosomal protein L37AE/L43A